jgi:hypothetical protein
MPQPSGGNSPQKRKVICPEENCNTETELTYNAETKEWEGDCPKCGLDVGWCVEKIRRDRAVRRLTEREAAENSENQPKKRRRLF